LGKIEIICGSMFSGKTEELIKRIKKSGKKFIVFKPRTDTRNKTNKIVSHDNSEINAKTISKSDDILKYSENYELIAIDEAQFFDNNIVDICTNLANSGTEIIIAGLDMDYSGKPFGPMPYLMAIADDVKKLHAKCSETGEPAVYSYRKTKNNSTIEVGDKDKYEPLSRKAYIQKNN
tara:strand:+ start:191 stop:721 length:531 start_codon:yes stop_codon:yes gene_type:complete